MICVCIDAEQLSLTSICMQITVFPTLTPALTGRSKIPPHPSATSELCHIPGGDSHMKQTGMLVVSLRGVNFGFWSRLGCSGHSTNILSRREKQNYAKRNRSQIFFQLVLFSYLCVFKRSLLGVKICVSHGQIGLL